MNKLIKNAVSLFAVFSALIVVSFAFSSENAWAEDSHPCDSIKNRETEALIIAKGQAVDAKWGWAKVSDVVYSFHVKSTSEIVKVDELRDGGRKVIEKRTFKNAEDQMIVTPVDYRLRLDTLPIDEIRQLLRIITVLTVPVDSSLTKIPASADYTLGKLKELDNKSLKKLIEKFIASNEVKFPAKFIDLLKKAFLGEGAIIKEFQGVRNLIFSNKKAFLVTWFFDKDGNVTDTIYRYEDGSLVTDEETRLILKRSNLIIDYCIERSNKAPLKDGNEGYIEANDIQSVFDPFVDGDYRGLIKAKANKINKSEWKLDMEKSDLRVEAKKGAFTKTTGKLNLTKGSLNIKNIEKEGDIQIYDLKGADFDAKVEGKAEMTHLTKHHWLFTAKFQGKCAFAGEMTSKVIEKK